MRHFLLALLLSPSLAFCGVNVNEHVNQEVSVSALVDGCVNAITGDYLDSSNDLVLVGPEPLVFERFSASSDFVSNNFMAGWRHTFDSWIQSDDQKGDKDIRYLFAILVEGCGRVTSFKGQFYHNHNIVHGKINPENLPRGMTNAGMGQISARTNPKNARLHFDRDSEDIEVKTPSETRLLYRKGKHMVGHNLISEEKPNTHKIEYKYNDEYQLNKVIATNKTGDKVYSTLRIEDKRESKLPTLKICGSDGQCVTYFLEKAKTLHKKDKVKARYFLRHAIKSDGSRDDYDYIGRRCSPGAMVCKHSKQEGRFKEIKYYNDQDKDKDFDWEENSSVNRVEYLKAPVGHDQQGHITYRFVYNHFETSKDNEEYPTIISGHTEVFDALNAKTAYHFQRSLLKRIEKFEGFKDHKLYSTERYFWDIQDDGIYYLTSRYFSDRNGAILSAHAYEYDAFGNILKDRHLGNITGQGPPVAWEEHHPVENGVDSYSHVYVYDGYDKTNLRLMRVHKEDNGKATHYEYYPNTDLLKQKVITLHDQIKIRYYYTYDDDGVAIKTIQDNGCNLDGNSLEGVTERKITYIYPQKTAPYGVPERTDEMYVDLKTGKEILLRRIIKKHNPQGRVLEESHYDANETYCFTLCWDYDARGNVIYHRDALGNISEKKYDLNSNLIFEREAGKNHYKSYTYDFSNRMIRSEEIYSNGTILATNYLYDLRGNKIAMTDSFGQTTQYSYDELGREIATTYPPIPNVNGNLTSHTTRKEYDVFGNITLFVDQLGNRTTSTYNIHGKPIRIEHPDGSYELYEYNLDGSLKKQRSRIGVYTHYVRDPLDRILTTKIRTESGDLLSTETNVYDGLQLLSSTDSLGRKTTCSYDGAGRIVLLDRWGLKTTYEYDSLGRISSTQEWYTPKDCKTTQKRYDYLDRVVEEWIEEKGKILSHTKFAYDPSGNVIARTQLNDEGVPATNYIEYNDHNQPIKKTDALGNSCHIHFDYKAIDKYGMTVLQTTLLDALGNQTITTHNALGKIATIEKRSPLGTTTAKKELFYDAVGDLVDSLEAVICQGKDQKVIHNHFENNAMHQLVKQVDAVGTPEQKVTTYLYNRKGQKSQLQKPNGVVIKYDYDEKGRLYKEHSSDKNYVYTYRYNQMDQIEEVINKADGTSTQRQYNERSQLIQEKLSNGLVIQYRYDLLDRPTQVIFPDKSAVSYEYDSCNLTSIERNGQRYRYRAYETIGFPKKMELPQSAGTLSVTYDLMHRPVEVIGKALSEKVAYDTVGNLIRAQTEKYTCDYDYDDLYQLKSETGIANHVYVNDSLYNCTQRDGIPRLCNNLNQLLQEGTTKYRYDLNGNLTYKDERGQCTHYRYDAFDRLIEVEKSGQVTKYVYDALHRRVAKKQGNKLIRYLYQGENEVGSVDENGKIIDLRLLGVGKGAEIGASVVFELKGQSYYPMHDHNGNVMALLDGTGAIAESYQYSAFGEEKILDREENEVRGSPLDNQWRYSSKRTDPETGFVYFGRRYYDPAACRWITADPLGYDGGCSNLYAYVMNSPLNHNDLYGLAISQAESNHVSFFSQIGSWANSLFSLATLPGRCLELVGEHIVPIPIFSDVLRVCGRFLQGQGLDFSRLWNSDESGKRLTQGTKPPENGIHRMGYNGVVVGSAGAEAISSSISFMLGGVEVMSIGSETHGLTSDLISCLYMIITGRPTTACYVLADELRNKLAEIPHDDSIHLIVHSRGGLEAYHALKMLRSDERDRIIVSTYGSAKIIDRDELGLKRAANYVSVLDPIPFIADLKGLLKGLFTGYGNVEFLPSRGMFGKDHEFSSDCYQKRLKHDLRSIDSIYGKPKKTF